jgi:WD40 repeat protein
MSDAAGRWAVTGSLDKTIRVWSLADGALLRTIRLPAGPGHVGQVYGVAMSPDGTLIAAGGITRPPEAQQQDLYVFDRESGALVRRIEGIPDAVGHLVFSPDGQLLAAALTYVGLRIYSREQDWDEIGHDVDYLGESYGATFASDGRLATTANDGKIRLYSGTFVGDLSPTISVLAPGTPRLRHFSFRPPRPYGIAFSPDGTRLAVGYLDRPAVALLDGHTLTPLSGYDHPNADNNNSYLHVVSWSRDGSTLFAAESFGTDDGYSVLAHSGMDGDPVRLLPAGHDIVTSLAPLPEGDLLVAAADPWLARLQTDGHAGWIRPPLKADFRDQTLCVSSDGNIIDFGFTQTGEMPVRLNLVTRELTLDPPTDGQTATQQQDGLPINYWRNSTSPTFGGRPLKLEPHENSRCFAIHPAGDRFVVGADWFLWAFDAEGTQLWRRPVSGGAVWAVNITGDGRLVITAYDDGTVRWHRMADGVELLACMPLPDRANWVAWTPEGFYAASPGAHGFLRWHVNRGWDEPADSVPIENIPGSYRPEILPLVLQELETPRALGLAVLGEHNRQVMLRTNSRVPPGTRLHLLTVGISDYNEDYAKHLRLRYADRDAHDLASAIVNTQECLYQVKPQVLRDRDANKAGILRALKTMRAGMAEGSGNDRAVVHFSGHGAQVDGRLYLLPHDVDGRDVVGIQSGGLSADEIRGELLALAKHGRVLVLLDACHSGATTIDGAALAMDSTALRTGLAAANVTVLTSSTGAEPSYEEPSWGHGAFTKVLLDALSDPDADIDRNGLISTAGLLNYVSNRVPSLTGGRQHPGMEVRFNATLFAVGR